MSGNCYCGKGPNCTCGEKRRLDSLPSYDGLFPSTGIPPPESHPYGAPPPAGPFYNTPGPTGSPYPPPSVPPPQGSYSPYPGSYPSAPMGFTAGPQPPQGAGFVVPSSNIGGNTTVYPTANISSYPSNGVTTTYVLPSSNNMGGSTTVYPTATIAVPAYNGNNRRCTTKSWIICAVFLTIFLVFAGTVVGLGVKHSREFDERFAKHKQEINPFNS